jgi:hypothetical protein
MRSIFILRAFVPSWQTSFRSEAEKFFISLAKELVLMLQTESSLFLKLILYDAPQYKQPWC